MLALGLTSAAFLTTSPTPRNGGFDSDGQIYARMVTTPAFTDSLETPRPWAYRVLTPKIAALLPGAMLNRFRAIAFVANAAALYLLWLLFAAWGCSAAASVSGVLLYSGVFWTLGFSFYSPAYVDGVSNLFLIATVYCIVTTRYMAAAAILAVSALQKESLPFFAVAVAADVLHQKRAWLLAAAVLIIPLAALRLVQMQIAAPEESFYQIVTEVRRAAHPAFWPVLIHALFSGLGLIPVLLLLRVRSWVGVLRRRPAFIVYLAVAVACLFGGVDKSRLFLYALPVVVLLALECLESLRVDLGRWFPYWAVLFGAAHAYLGNYLTPMGTFGEYVARLLPEHAASGQISHVTFLLRDLFIAGVVLAIGVALSLRSIGRPRADEASAAS